MGLTANLGPCGPLGPVVPNRPGGPIKTLRDLGTVASDEKEWPSRIRIIYAKMVKIKYSSKSSHKMFNLVGPYYVLSNQSKASYKNKKFIDLH